MTLYRVEPPKRNSKSKRSNWPSLFIEPGCKHNRLFCYWIETDHKRKTNTQAYYIFQIVCKITWDKGGKSGKGSSIYLQWRNNQIRSTTLASSRQSKGCIFVLFRRSSLPKRVSTIQYDKFPRAKEELTDNELDDAWYTHHRRFDKNRSNYSKKPKRPYSTAKQHVSITTLAEE